MGQLAQRAVGLSQRPEGGRVRFRLVGEPGGLLGGLPASEQNPPGSDVKDLCWSVNLRARAGQSPLFAVFLVVICGRYWCDRVAMGEN